MIIRFAFIAYSVVIFCVGALFHERDIQRECKENGRTGKAAWTGEMECKPFEKQNDGKRVEE